MNSQQETEGSHLFSVHPDENADADDTCPVCEMPYETSYRRWNEEMGCYICPDCQDQMEWENED